MKKIILEIRGKRYSLKEVYVYPGQISSQPCPECGHNSWIISDKSGKTRIGCSNQDCPEHTRKASQLVQDVKDAKRAFYGRRDTF